MLDSAHKNIENKYPFLKFFYTPGKVFVYDGKANFVFSLPSRLANVLYDFLSGLSGDDIILRNSGVAAPSAIASTLNRLGYLISRGVFLPGPLEEVSPVSKEKVRATVDYFSVNILIRKFCLEVTQDCNFACKYCQCTLGVKHNNPEHAYMTRDVAQRSINYYFNKYTGVLCKLSSEKKEKVLRSVKPLLGFYGGEPFMNFDVVKYSVDYFRNLDWQKHGIDPGSLHFTINSNMYVLTSEMMEFLKANDMTLYASLDGPRSEHNKNRVTKSGKGTFDVVYRNIEKLWNFDPEYFNRKVVLMGVVAENHDMKKYNRFINYNDGFHRLSAGYWVSDVAKKGCFVLNPAGKLKALEEKYESDLKEFGKFVSSGENHNGDLEENSIERLKHLIKFGKMRFDKPNGSARPEMLLTCPVGIDNLMVSPDGTFHTCHKTDCSYGIGNCYTGIDPEKITEFLTSYNKRINENGCRSCLMVHFCHFCSATRLVNHEFVNPGQAECDYTRRTNEKYLNQFFILSEHNPRLFEETASFTDDLRKYVSIIDINRV